MLFYQYRAGLVSYHRSEGCYHRSEEVYHRWQHGYHRSEGVYHRSRILPQLSSLQGTVNEANALRKVYHRLE